MRNLRLYDPEYLCEVTIRTQDGEFGFDLNDMDLRDLIYGVFAEGAARYGVEIFIFHFMSNHYHGLYGFATPQQLVCFFAYVHGQLARVVNARLGRRGTFWAPLKVCAVTPDAESVAQRFRYIMGQATKAKLCDHPSQFPGPSTLDALLYGVPLMGRKIDRTQRCRDAARLVGGAKDDAEYTTWVELPVAVPRCWAHLSATERQQMLRGIADELAEAHGGGEAQRQLAQAQVPGVCLTDESSQDSAEPSDPTAPADPAPRVLAKRRVADRRAEDGGRYRHGPVRPKDGAKVGKRGKFPRLLSVHAELTRLYEQRYCAEAEAYRQAKLDWRLSAQLRQGALHAAEIALPPWMLLGTLPLVLKG